MKRIGLIMALIFTLGVSTSFAKTYQTSIAIGCDFGITTQSSISTETALRVLKLASYEVSETYAELVEMYNIGQVSITETNETNVYLVSIQQTDGGIVDVIILDQI